MSALGLTGNQGYVVNSKTDLLQLGTATTTAAATGLSSSVIYVQDGAGVTSALGIATGIVNINGTFKVGGFTMTVPAAVTFGGAFTTSGAVTIGSGVSTVAFLTSANTSVTLPTTGTLATLAGTETLTNKTITSPVVNQILDANGNEQIKFVSTASAVNELNIANTATGNSPYLEITGGDTNIGMEFQVKGTGTYNLKGTATTSAALRLFELVGNGSNYVYLQSPASVASNVGWLLPSVDGTGLLESNGSGTLSFGTLTGTPATQAAQETGSSLVAAVTPGRQQFHPSACKGWVLANFGATVSASYNVTSVTDNGTGTATVNWATDFSSANQCSVGNIVFTPTGASNGTISTHIADSLGAGTTNVQSILLSSYAAADGNYFTCASFGDQ